jgi:U3 small nucleolar RNA-associated protein 15
MVCSGYLWCIAYRFTSPRQHFDFLLLFASLLQTKEALSVVSLMEELHYRQGTKIALQGRNDETLEPLLRFLVKYLCHPQYSSVLVNVCEMVIDMYAQVVGQSVAIDEQFKKLESAMRRETQLHQKLLPLLGALETLMQD